MLVVPNVQEVLALQAWVDYAPPWTVRLFGNDHTPAAGDTAASYTEVSGGGYTPYTVGSTDGAIQAYDVPGFTYGLVSDALLTSAASAWGFGDYVSVLYNYPSAIRLLGVNIQIQTVPTADVTVEQIFELGITDDAGILTTRLQLPYSFRADTAVGYYLPPTCRIVFPEPLQFAALAMLWMRVADSLVTAQTYTVDLLGQPTQGVAGSWTISPDAPSTAIATPRVFAFTGVLDAPGGIYGYFITDAAGALVTAERGFAFPHGSTALPFRPGVDTGTLTITPTVRLGSVSGD